MPDNQNLNEVKKKELQSLFLHSSSYKSISKIHTEIDSRNGALMKSVPPSPIVHKSCHSKKFKAIYSNRRLGK